MHTEEPVFHSMVRVTTNTATVTPEYTVLLGLDGVTLSTATHKSFRLAMQVAKTRAISLLILAKQINAWLNTSQACLQTEKAPETESAMRPIMHALTTVPVALGNNQEITNHRAHLVGWAKSTKLPIVFSRGREGCQYTSTALLNDVALANASEFRRADAEENVAELALTKLREWSNILGAENFLFAVAGRKFTRDCRTATSIDFYTSCVQVLTDALAAGGGPVVFGITAEKRVEGVFQSIDTFNYAIHSLISPSFPNATIEHSFIPVFYESQFNSGMMVEFIASHCTPIASDIIPMLVCISIHEKK